MAKRTKHQAMSCIRFARAANDLPADLRESIIVNANTTLELWFAVSERIEFWEKTGTTVDASQVEVLRLWLLKYENFKR